MSFLPSRMLYVFWFAFLMGSLSCNQSKNIAESSDCDEELAIRQKYQSDMNKVTQYYATRDSADIQFPWKAYCHLEILSTGNRNIDFLAIELYENNRLSQERDQYFKKWGNWLDENPCFTIQKANNIFAEINTKYKFSEIKVDSAELARMRQKFRPSRFADMSNHKIDSFVTSWILQERQKNVLGWNGAN